MSPLCHVRTQRDRGEVWGQLKVGGEEGHWKNGNESQHVTGKRRVPQISRSGIWSTVLVLQNRQTKLGEIQRGAIGGPRYRSDFAFQEIKHFRWKWGVVSRIKCQENHEWPERQKLRGSTNPTSSSWALAVSFWLTELSVPNPCVLTSVFSSQGIALAKSSRHSWKVMVFSCWKLFYACKSSQGTLWKTNQRALRMHLKDIYSQI